MIELNNSNIQAWSAAKTSEVADFIVKKFDLPKFKEELHTNFSISQGRRRNWGGIKFKHGNAIPKMSLSLFNRHLTTTFNEYASFAHLPEIGTVKGTTREVVTALICHELAHAVDYYARNSYYANLDNVEKVAYAEYTPRSTRMKASGGHGDRWQAIYAILRRQFVNNGVSEPTIVEKKSKRKSPKRQIEVKRVTNIYNEVKSIYFYNDKRIGYGERWVGGFLLTIIENGKPAYRENLPNGRGARKFLLEQVVPTLG